MSENPFTTIERRLVDNFDHIGTRVFASGRMKPSQASPPMDKAKTIAGYDRSFLVALLASHKEAPVVAPPPDIEPVTPPKLNVFAALWQAFIKGKAA